MVPTKTQATLAGIAAGAIGGAVILVFMAMASLANEDPWWRYPNLVASAIYGAPALRAGAGVATVGGAGLQIVTSGIAGGVFALVFARWFRTRRLTLIGAVAGLAWMYVAGSITARFAPLIPLYTPTVASTIAYLLFGLCLGTARWFLPTPPRAEEVGSAAPAGEAGAVLPPAAGAEQIGSSDTTGQAAETIAPPAEGRGEARVETESSPREPL